MSHPLESRATDIGKLVGKMLLTKLRLSKTCVVNK